MARSSAGREQLTAPRIAVLPDDTPVWVKQAIERGGGELSDVRSASGLVWYGYDAQELRRVLEAALDVRWVQLRSAGVERYRDLLIDGRTWTGAKGVLGETVAEHALALALAWLRAIPQAARTRRWASPRVATLLGSRITIVGAGGIGTSLLAMLAPFHAHITVVRRRPIPVPGAERTLSADRILEAVRDADVVVLAAALTEGTRGIIAEAQLRAMSRHALLVNVGRGGLVRTDDLVAALRDAEIGGAALDVVDPEPLPADHALWGFENVLITAHIANTDELGAQRLADLFEENVRRLAQSEPLLGQIDPKLGY